MFLRVDRILRRVSSLPAAVAYYRDALGLGLIREEATLAVFRLGDEVTELVLHTEADLPSEATYLLVDDVKALFAQRKELKLTFISPPTAVARGFRATVKDPFGIVHLLLDRSADPHAAHTVVESGTPPGSLFGDVSLKVAPKQRLLAVLYEAGGRTADDLPYTPHFEAVYGPYIEKFDDPKPPRSEVWRHLLTMRKAGKLPKLGEARSPAPEVPAESRTTLRKLLGDDIGKRDRLPYTPRFDEIAEAFNKTLPRAMAPHFVWRLIASLAK